jgi:hypothetical protein
VLEQPQGPSERDGQDSEREHENAHSQTNRIIC